MSQVFKPAVAKIFVNKFLVGIFVTYQDEENTPNNGTMLVIAIYFSLYILN